MCILIGTLQVATMDANFREEQIQKIIWYLDNNCSIHMTNAKSLLFDYHDRYGQHVTFGDNLKDITRGYGTIKVSSIIIEHVSYVGLKHNCYLSS